MGGCRDGGGWELKEDRLRIHGSCRESQGW